MRRELDVVVYGASGFTGRLVARYLGQHGSLPRIGLAGRSAEKLAAVRDEVARVAPGFDPALVVARSDDERALEELCARTRVVLSTAGPFTPCGTPLVRACVSAATDYVDINGEVPWMQRLIRELDGPAARGGVRIVPGCGFCAPSELATHRAVSRLRQRHGVAARHVSSFVVFNGKLSGGTLATGALLDVAGDDTQAVRRDPFALGGAPEGGTPRPEDSDLAAAEFNNFAHRWCAPTPRSHLPPPAPSVPTRA